MDPKAADYQGYESIKPTAPPSAPLALNVGVIGITDREHQVKLTWTEMAARSSEGNPVFPAAPGTWMESQTANPDNPVMVGGGRRWSIGMGCSTSSTGRPGRANGEGYGIYGIEEAAEAVRVVCRLAEGCPVTVLDGPAS